jgi:hypothetical protein
VLARLVTSAGARIKRRRWVEQNSTLASDQKISCVPLP